MLKTLINGNILSNSRISYNEQKLLLLSRAKCKQKKLMLTISKWEFDTSVKHGIYENLGFNKNFKCIVLSNAIVPGKKHRKHIKVIKYKVIIPFKLSNGRYMNCKFDEFLDSVKVHYKLYSSHHESMFDILSRRKNK